MDKPSQKPAKKLAKKTGIMKPPPDVNADADQITPRAGSQRSALLKVTSKISRSVADCMPKDGDNKDNSGISIWSQNYLLWMSSPVALTLSVTVN